MIACHGVQVLPMVLLGTVCGQRGHIDPKYQFYHQCIYMSNAITNVYDEWGKTRTRRPRRIRKYEESRNWVNAPAVIKPHFSDASRNNFPEYF